MLQAAKPCLTLVKKLLSMNQLTLPKQKYEKFSSSNDDDIVVNRLSKLEIVKFSFIGALVAVACYVLLRYILPLIGITQTAGLELGAISLAISSQDFLKTKNFSSIGYLFK